VRKEVAAITASNKNFLVVVFFAPRDPSQPPEIPPSSFFSLEKQA